MTQGRLPVGPPQPPEDGDPSAAAPDDGVSPSTQPSPALPLESISPTEPSVSGPEEGVPPWSAAPPSQDMAHSASQADASSPSEQDAPPVAAASSPVQADEPPVDRSLDERVARKVDAIRNVLRLERRQDHANRAVFGGLNAFFERWLEDPDIGRVLDAARVSVPSYGNLNQEARASWVSDALTRLGAPPHEDASPPPAEQRSIEAPPRPPLEAPEEPSPPMTASQANDGTTDTPPQETPHERSDAAVERLGQPSPPPWSREQDVAEDTSTEREPSRAPRQPDGAASDTATRQMPNEQNDSAPELPGGPPKRAAARRSAAPKRAAKAATVASLDDPLDAPPRMKAGLTKLGIMTYHDALWAFPRRYLPVEPVARLRLGEQAAVAVRVERAAGGRYTSGRQLLRVEATVTDDTANVSVVWFGNPWIAKIVKRGARFLLIGRLSDYRGRSQFTVDTYEELRVGDRIVVGDLVPMYPLTKGVTQSGMRRLIGPAAERALPLVQEFLPQDVVRSARLPGLQEALRLIHKPDDLGEDERARRRLAFDELFLLQLGLLKRRRQQQLELGSPIPRNDDTINRILEALPFALTDDQTKAVDEVLADMGKSAPMMRLLQGDVGSGKTVVATLALATAAAKGFQGAMMAPTEVLAEQHFRTLTSIFSQNNRESNDGGPYRGFQGILADRPLRVALLTGSMGAGAKTQLHDLISRGDVDIVIGTHALIQQGVGFKSLGLAVVDEQHRFGVGQRASLRNKGLQPHLLVMTATPIPRTMALAIYGDLDVSTIKEMPPGRPSIRTAVVPPEERDRAYGFIRKEAGERRQSFVICPLVEESETVAAKAAVAEHERLSRDVFPDLSVGLLHGRMRPREKEAVMEAFRDGSVDVLVSTAVVEVGIDVPNATVMMIDGAERFGLSQLHQYRGRVGRGTQESYCILVSESETPEAQERLAVMESTRDGFELAEADLKLRGPGELMGTRQSGIPDLQVATFGDLSLIEEARDHALDVAQKDPELRDPANLRLREELDRFWRRASETPEGG